MNKKKTYLLIAVAALLLLLPSMLLAKEYYVSTLGNDSNSGLSSSSAWKTLDKVNSFPFVPGDIVRFERGAIWRGQLIPRSGSSAGYITYTSYGSVDKAKPLFLGSLLRNLTTDWIQVKTNIWESATTANTDVGNIIFNNGVDVGFKVWNYADLDEQNKFWFDRITKKVRIYSTKNPALIYSDIELALTRHIVVLNNKSFVYIDGLHLSYGGAHGIFVTNFSNYIVLMNNDISYIGGGDQYQDGSNLKYGNGIEVWENANNIEITGNRIWQIFDAALTNQGLNINQQYNIYYSNNMVWKSQYCFEYWNKPSTSTTHDIYFYNNMCSDTGRGWGLGQRGGGLSAAYHIAFKENSANTYNFYIWNNIFRKTSFSNIVLRNSQEWAGLGLLYMDTNIHEGIYPIAWWGSTIYMSSDFNAYKTATGKEANSKLLTLQSIQVLPQSIQLTVNKTQQLQVTGIYSDGVTTSDLTHLVSYTSSNEAVASVGSVSIVKGLGGLVKGLALGSSTITVRSETLTATTTVTVQ